MFLARFYIVKNQKIFFLLLLVVEWAECTLSTEYNVEQRIQTHRTAAFSCSAFLFTTLLSFSCDCRKSSVFADASDARRIHNPLTLEPSVRNEERVYVMFSDYKLKSLRTWIVSIWIAINISLRASTAVVAHGCTADSVRRFFFFFDAGCKKSTRNKYIFRLHEAWIGLRIIQDVAKLHAKFAPGLRKKRRSRKKITSNRNLCCCRKWSRSQKWIASEKPMKKWSTNKQRNASFFSWKLSIVSSVGRSNFVFRYPYSTISAAMVPHVFTRSQSLFGDVVSIRFETNVSITTWENTRTWLMIHHLYVCALQVFKSNRANNQNRWIVSFSSVVCISIRRYHFFFLLSLSGLWLCFVASMTMMICVQCEFRDGDRKRRKKKNWNTEVSSRSDLMRPEECRTHSTCS